MAAGTSTRFAPLSYEKPKGLLEVKGEVLIERQIRQLHEAGIHDITVVVGYRSEMFRYLEEKLNVRLVMNEDYSIYNNTSSIIRVLDQLADTYICSSDNYFPDNVFIALPPRWAGTRACACAHRHTASLHETKNAEVEQYSR